jgi:molybdenum ABC transporter molybdate-binding protein
MSKTVVAMFASLLALGGMTWALMNSDVRRTSAPSDASQPGSAASQGDSKTAEISLFCAASNQAVMEEIRREYEAETGRRVVIQYGSSQSLLSQIEVSGTGDLYLPADDSFLTMGREKNLIAETIEIAAMNCGIVVARGNPKGIDDLSDLFATDVRLVQANPDAAAIAKLTKQITTASGLWGQLDKATAAYRTTVTDVANDVLVGAADAGIVYDAVLHTYPDLQFVSVPELAAGVSQVSVGVIASSAQPSAALHFARYVSARDRGLKYYESHGFKTAGGDEWNEEPELTIYAGSMLRPAIEDTIVAFEEREGVRVSRAYNGCGILVAQMKSGQHPDAYFACDLEFMNQVKDLFPEPVSVSQNELVILVEKGNPQKISSLRDLTKEGLRVGIGHEKQCAMGWITQNTFKESGLQTELMANVTVQTPTGDMLVNQLRTGSLDAAVAYLSNAAGAAEFLDAVQIRGIPCSTATQPWAVAKESRFPKLAGRLFDHLSSTDSQEIFAAEGFQWKLAK